MGWLYVFMPPGEMLLQRLQIHEVLIADCAGKITWDVLLVPALYVRTKAGKVCEGITAILAHMWPLAKMSVNMILQRVFEAVCFLTVWTVKLASC